MGHRIGQKSFGVASAAEAVLQAYLLRSEGDRSNPGRVPKRQRRDVSYVFETWDCACAKAAEGCPLQPQSVVENGVRKQQFNYSVLKH